MHISLLCRLKSLGRGFAGKVGSLLYRTRLGLIAFFFTLACGGPSESTQPDREIEVASARIVIESTAPAPPLPLIDVSDLPAVSAGPKSRGAGPNPGIDPDLRDALNWALLEYRTAFVGRDLEKLESIWTMGAVERLLIENAWTSCEKIELALKTTDMKVTGRSAVVDFDQELTFLCPNEARTSHSALTASLELNQEDTWRISRIGNREAAPVRSATSGPASLAPGAGSQPDGDPIRRALQTLSDYESALQRCDLDGLARVWIMTDLERQILQGLCFRSGELDVTISDPQVSTSEDTVSIDFTHDFKQRGRRGPMQTRSRLTALLVERGDGNWAIWKVRSAE